MWTKKDSPVKNLAGFAGKKSVSARQARRLIRSRASRSGRLASLRKTLNSSITAPYPDIFVSLDKGLVDVGIASAPRPGMRELVRPGDAEDSVSARGDYSSTAVIYCAERPLVLNFVKAFVEGMKVVREKPAGRRCRFSGETFAHSTRCCARCAGAYRSFVNVWEEVPYVRAESVQAILDLSAERAGKRHHRGKVRR